MTRHAGKSPERARVGRRNRAAGGQSERAFNHFLTAWWYDLIDRRRLAAMCGSVSSMSAIGRERGKAPDGEVEFIRTPGSGSWDRKAAGGDARTPEDFPGLCEMKWYRSARVFAALFAKGGILGLWWAQAVKQVEDAMPTTKRPMLMAAAADLPPSFILPVSIVHKLLPTVPERSLIVRCSADFPRRVEAGGALVVVPLPEFITTAYGRAEVTRAFG